MNPKKPKSFVSSINSGLQGGFSLIELMISLTLGMIVVLFVTNLYVGSRSSSRLQEETARLNEDGRAAMHLLGRNIKQAWFGNPVSYFLEGMQTDFNGNGLIACDNGFADVNAPANITCGNGGGSVALQVSFRGADVANPNTGAGTDCNGQTVAGPPRIVINRFYLATRSGDSFPSLFCSGNGNATPQPVLANVEDLVLTYGIDVNNDRTADSYTNSAATALTLSPQSPGFPTTGFPAFRRVVSVGVCMQMVSSGLVVSGKQTYVDCNGTSQTSSDRRLRMVMRNTYTIRNSSDSTPIRR